MKESNNPLVSIIVITYNSAKYVLETLESVKSQEYTNIELIVSDDASKDETVQLCRKWLDENRQRFVHSEIICPAQNSGIAPNCNRGVAAASGEWIKIIAGDDSLEPTIIKEYINFVGKQKDAVCMYSNVKEYDDIFDDSHLRPIRNLKHFKINHPDIKAHEQFKILLRMSPVWASTIMTRKDVLESIGRFNERYPFFEDRPMLLALTKAGYKVHFLDIVGAKYRRHSESVQSIKNAVFMSRLMKNREDYLISEQLHEFTRMEQAVMLFRRSKNRFLAKTFNNKRNRFVTALSYTLDLFPKIYLSIAGKAIR